MGHSADRNHTTTIGPATGGRRFATTERGDLAWTQSPTRPGSLKESPRLATREPGIRAAAQRRRGVAVALARNAERAAEDLGKMATGQLPSDGARVRAAIAVVELSVQALTLEDLARDVAELKAQSGGWS
jgi:hypothetical protein